jgi:hypothetical protein
MLRKTVIGAGPAHQCTDAGLGQSTGPGVNDCDCTNAYVAAGRVGGATALHVTQGQEGCGCETTLPNF